MSDQRPVDRPRSHRAPVTSVAALRRLFPPVAAVVVVAAVIVILILINGHSSPGPSAAVVSGSTPTPAASRQPSTVTGTTSPPATVAQTPTVAPTHRPSHRPGPTPSVSHSPTAPAAAPVEVLNNSRRSGLAHEVAAELESRGFAVWHVGNLRGRIAATTVYYAPGDYAAAQRLAGAFGSIQRIEPSSALGLPSSGLTLVVTRSWAS